MTVTFTDRNVEAYHAIVRLAAERAMNGSPPLKLIEYVPTKSLTLSSDLFHSSIDISLL